MQSQMNMQRKYTSNHGRAILSCIERNSYFLIYGVEYATKKIPLAVNTSGFANLQILSSTQTVSNEHLPYPKILAFTGWVVPLKYPEMTTYHCVIIFLH